MTRQLSVVCALLFAPGLALAQAQGQPMNRPSQNQPTQTQRMNQPAASQRLLPTDAKLVGVAESTDVRTFPEQAGAKGEKASQVQKEEVAGVGAVDRVWETGSSFQQTVNHFDQAIKSEKAEPIAVTTTKTAKAWNLRLPDGHITNVVVRNTRPTTIESVEVSGGVGTMDLQKQNK